MQFQLRTSTANRRTLLHLARELGFDLSKKGRVEGQDTERNRFVSYLRDSGVRSDLRYQTVHDYVSRILSNGHIPSGTWCEDLVEYYNRKQLMALVRGCPQTIRGAVEDCTPRLLNADGKRLYRRVKDRMRRIGVQKLSLADFESSC